MYIILKKELSQEYCRTSSFYLLLIKSAFICCIFQHLLYDFKFKLVITPYIVCKMNLQVRPPGRDRILALCLALSLSFEETQRALTLANTGALYARRIRDSILIFALQKNLSVLDANILLSEYSEEPLS